MRAEHVLALQGEVQTAQIYFQGHIDRAYAEELEAISNRSEAGCGFAGLDEAGRVRGAIGICPKWEGVGFAWALISKDGGPYLRHATVAVRSFLAHNPSVPKHYRRIETFVHCDFAAGHRWMRLLGFEMEAERLRAAAPCGADVALYAYFPRGDAP